MGVVYSVNVSYMYSIVPPNALCLMLNAFLTLAGVSRRLINNFRKLFKNYKIVEFHEFISNPRENGFQISTNMPSIAFLMRKTCFL